MLDIDALKRGEERLRKILDGMPVMVVAIDDRNVPVFWNGECESQLGWSASEIIDNPRSAGFVFPEEDRFWGGAIVHRQEDDYREMEVEMACKDGSIKTIAWSNVSKRVPIPGWAEWGVGVDITARKRAEQAIRESEARLRLAVSAASIGFWSWDFATDAIYLSATWKAQIGYEDYELSNVRITWEERLHPDDRRRVLASITKAVEGTAQGFDLDYRLRHKNGTYRWILSRGAIARDDEGKAARLMCCHLDITDRKASDEKQRKQALLLDLASDAICVRDLEDRIVYWNQGAETLYGWTSEEAIGCVSHDLLNTRLPASVEETNQIVLAHGRWEGEIEHRTKSGDWVVVASHWVLETDDAGAPIAILELNLDITELKWAKMQHSQKLESLGVLAGGIAHDFNNLLTAMMGNASLALDQLAPHLSAYRYVQEIEKAAQRAADLTQQILAYAGKGRFLIRSLDLADVVREMSSLLGTAISKKANLELDLQRAPAAGDATQIRQIALNLLTNASDALGGSEGRICLRTGVMKADRATLASRFISADLPEGDYAFLEVTDTGVGMDDATLARIFDPFFSTKFTGRGLGLAATIGIVRGHKGTIRVHSHPGEGSSFLVLLPFADSSGDDLAPAATAPPRGSGVVLVIEDESFVREVATSVLEQAGYSVLTAVDGVDGVDVFQRHASEISVVLLDMTMPHKSGAEVLREIQALRPDIHVVLTSGHSEQDIRMMVAGGEATAFLPKPYDPAHLLAVLEKTLSSSTDPPE